MGGSAPGGGFAVIVDGTAFVLKPEIVVGQQLGMDFGCGCRNGNGGLGELLRSAGGFATTLLQKSEAKPFLTKIPA